MIRRQDPTAATGVRSQGMTNGICSGPNGTGAASQVLGVPLSILISQTAPHTLAILSPTLSSRGAESVLK
jgi:hypothetical protein